MKEDSDDQKGENITQENEENIRANWGDKNKNLAKQNNA